MDRTAQHSTAQHSTAQHSAAQHSASRRWIAALLIALSFTALAPEPAKAALDSDWTDVVVCNACTASQRLNAATTTIPRDGNDWTILVFDTNTFAVSTFVGFREYDRELRRTFSAIYEVPNDPEALEVMQAFAQMMANLNSARMRVSPSSVLSVDGVVKGSVPAGVAPIEIPPMMGNIDTSSWDSVRTNESALLAISAFVAVKLNSGVVVKLNWRRILRAVFSKAVKNVTVMFSDGSTVTLEYTGAEFDPALQWRVVDGSATGSAGGAGGGGEGGTGGGGGGGGLRFFYTCIFGSVTSPGGVSHDSVCFYALTP